MAMRGKNMHLAFGTIEYTVKANDYALTFYGDMDVYIGNFNIKVAEPVIEREDYYEATAEQIKAEGGYTYDWSDNNIVHINNNTKYVKISTMEDAELKSALESTGAFTKDYALKFAGASSSIISFLTGKLTVGQNYTVSFDAYVKTAGSVTVLLMNAGGTQVGKSDFNVTDNSNGTKFYTTTFKAKEGYNSVNLYIVTECELYLANLTIAETVPVVDDGLVDITVEGTKAWSDCGLSGKHTVIDTPAEAAGKKGFADKALQFVTPNANYTMELFRMGDITQKDANFKKIDVTVYYYVVEMTGSGLHINLDNADFPVLEGGVGYHAVTVTIEHGFDFFSLYVNGSTTGTIVLGSVDYVVYTRGEPPVVSTKVNVVNAGVKAWSDCGFAGKHTVIDTPAELLLQPGFDTKALKHTTPSANISWELFRSGALVASNENYKSSKFIVYYNVDEISGTGLYINLDNAKFVPIPATVGYHQAVIELDSSFDFFSFYVDGSTTATLTLGSIYYEITSEEEQTSDKTYGTLDAGKLNVGNKGAVAETSSFLTGAYGYGEKTAVYNIFNGMNDNKNIVEVYQLSEITGLENFKSVTLKVYYYVEPGFNGNLYFFDNAANFVPMPVTSGFHVAEITIDYAAGWFLFHTNTGTGGTVHLGSIDYVVTYNA